MLRQNGPQAPQHLATLVEDMASWGAAPAVVEHRGVRRFSTGYRELAQLARRFAAELERRGIAPGDRVVLWGANGAAWIAAYFGCVLRGVLPVPLDAAGSPAFAAHVAAEVAPRLVVGDRQLLRSGFAGLPRLLLEELAAAMPAEGLARPVEGLAPESPLQILFTSGTTGVPKGVVHTHRNLLASLQPIAREIAKYRRYERLVHPLRFLHTLPLSHVFGQFMGLWVPPLLGAVVHYEERVTGSRLSASIAEDRIHVLAGVPRTLELLRGHLCAEDPSLPARVEAARGLPLARRWWLFRDVHWKLGLRFWASVCGGATLPEPAERFWTTMGFALIQGYGLTETSALVTLNHPFKTARGSVGTPLPGRSLRITEAGELEVKGDMVATRTWQNGGLVERSDPWLRTGDLASIGEDGRVRFLGRSGQRLVTAAGLNVYLEDVEAAMTAQPAVLEAMALAITTASGEEPGAVVVAPDGRAAATAAIAAANDALEPHQRVRQWWVWPQLALPRTGSGKLARKQVETWVAGQREATGARPAANGTPDAAANPADDPVGDLLLSVGATQGPVEDTARLEEDWRLDSMGRVALAAALEERAGVALSDAAAAGLRTLGDLRAVLRGAGRPAPVEVPVPAPGPAEPGDARPPREPAAPEAPSMPSPVRPLRQHYPRWPWMFPCTWVRAAFLEGLAGPLTWLLARPRVFSSFAALPLAPMLLVANHRTAVDVPLLLYALPGRVRRRTAVAMSGEMLEGWLRSWSLRRLPPTLAPHRRWWGPLAAIAVRALLNVFPLPAGAGFRASFAHAGRALDRGYSVLIFPEGRRSRHRQILPFKGGVGILAAESYVPVLPLALTIPQKPEHGQITISAGEPVEADRSDTCSPEAAEMLTRRLQASVEALLEREDERDRGPTP